MKKIALIAVSVVVACLAIEAYLRLALPQIYEFDLPGMYETDPQIGYVLAAGFEGWHNRPEFRTRVRINESGLRGPDLRPRKSNTVRILALGDGFTWGWGTNDDEAWPAVAERLLSEKYPRLDIQVLNAGTPGYGTDEELAFLESNGAELQPDLVVTMFYAANDFDDNRELARNTHTVRDGMLHREVAPATAKSRPAWLRARAWMVARSHLAKFTSERLGYLAARIGIYTYLKPLSSEDFIPEDTKRAVELLVGISDVAKGLGAQRLFVYVPPKMQILSGRMSRAADVLEEAARQAGAPWINLTAPIIEATNKTELYYMADGHWTPAGHRLAARIISAALVEVVLKSVNSTDPQ